MRYNRLILFFFLSYILVTSALAQSFSLKTDARTIGKNDVLQAEYEVKDGSDISGFMSPVFADWKVISGPTTSQTMSYINGQSSRTFSYIFLLSPVKTGNLTVPGIGIVADGKKMECKGITVKVTDQSIPKQSSPQPNTGLQSLFNDPVIEDLFTRNAVLKANEKPDEVMRKSIFLRAVASKSSCYAGEPVLVTYKLYTSINTESRVVKQPAFSGCSVIEITSDDGAYVEKINGKNYRTYTIRKVILVPLQEGTINLDAASVENVVNFADAGNPYSVKKYSSTLSNPPASITVNALPQKNKPVNFSGAVGNFSIYAGLKANETGVGDNNTLVIKISGSGNLQNIELPSISWPGNTEHFDATKKEDIDKTKFPLSGDMIFEIPFIGTKEGKQTILPVKLTYFDPAAQDYKTVATDSLRINFIKSSAVHTVITEPIVQQDVSNKKYLWIVAGIALAAACLLFFTLRKSSSAKNPLPATLGDHKTESTPVVEIKNPIIKEHTDFNTALEMLRHMDEPQLFYTSAKKLLTQALKESLGTDAPVSELVAILQTKTGNEPLTIDCINLFRTCEFALYSGIINENDKTDLLDNLEGIIKELHV